MKANIHRAVEDITKAIAPILFKIQDYDVIFPAMCMCMARVIQSTPDRGNELLIMEDAYTEIKHALTQFLEIEREKEATKAKLDAGIAGFASIAVAEQPVIEPGSAADHPDNPNQNVAKTVAPFPNEDLPPYTEEELESAPPAGGTINAICQGPTCEDIMAEEAEQAKQDTYKEAP